MSTVMIADLTLSQDLDKTAMANVLGRGYSWEYLGTDYYTGSYNYHSTENTFLGNVYKDGKWWKKYFQKDWYKQVNWKANKFHVYYN